MSLYPVKYNIPAQTISPDTALNKWYQELDKYSLRETRLISQSVFDVPCEINIYSQDKISIAMFADGEMSWLIIKSKWFSKSMKSIFDIIWKIAK